jgi:type IV secretory pathway VirB4 component
MTSGGQKLASTQAYLPISEIKEGVVVMKDHSLRAVLIASSLNFALKSEQEKDAIVAAYQSFLNSLSFPIQIVASSRKLDLTKYIDGIKGLAGKQNNPLIKVQTEEYAAFIEKMLEYSNIMEKRFYVVVPYFPAGIEVTGRVNDMVGKKSKVPVGSFEDNKKKLLARVELILSGLTSVGLRCSSLTTKDLLELYYTAYNPDTAQNQKLTNIENFDEPIVSLGVKTEVTDVSL